MAHFDLKYYRDTCRSLMRAITEDLEQRRRTVEQLGAQCIEAEQAITQLYVEIQDLGRRVQNGMITRAAAEAEGHRLAAERARLTAIMETEKRNYTLNCAKYDKFARLWETHGEPLGMICDIEREDDRLIECFDMVIEVLKRYRGLINGVADEGERFDFDALEAHLRELVERIKEIIYCMMK